MRIARFLILFFLLMGTTQVFAQGLSSYLFVAGNETSLKNHGKHKTTDASGIEGGLALMMGTLGFEAFADTLKYVETVENPATEALTVTNFDDKVYGYGLRVLTRGGSIKVGRATHDIISTKTVDDELVEEQPFNGEDTGTYFGGSLNFQADPTVDVYIDLTRYRMPEADRKLDKITFGVRLHLGRKRKGGGK